MAQKSEIRKAKRLRLFRYLSAVIRNRFNQRFTCSITTRSEPMRRLLAFSSLVKGCFLDFFLWRFAIFVQLIHTLITAIRLYLDMLYHFYTDRLFPYLEIMRTAVVSKNSNNLFCFCANYYLRLDGMAFFLSGVPALLSAFWAFNRALRDINQYNFQVFITQKLFLPGKPNSPLRINTFSTHTTISCAVLSAIPYSWEREKNVTYSRQYLQASISISVTGSLLCRPLL